MGIILYMIIAGMSLAMFVVRKEQKLALLIFYSMCLSSVSRSAYLGNSLLTPSLCFFLSELIRFKRYYCGLKTTPLLYIYIMMGIATFIVFLTSPNLPGMKGLYKIFRVDFVSNYFAILYALFSLKSIKGFKTIVNTAVVSILILTAFGLLNLITHHAIFVDWALEGAASLNDIMEDAGAKFTDDAHRFRVQSMHANPFIYGYICMFSSVLFIYAMKINIIKRSKFVICFMCCLFGIITCATRTVLLCSFACYVTYYVFTQRMQKVILNAILFFIIVILMYVYIPSVHEKMQFLLSMFEGGQNVDVGGSSIDMRLLQLMTVLYYIQGHFLLGRGHDFFNVELGFSEGKSGLLDKDLYGLEGVHLKLLLERGLIGLLFYALFWLSLFCLFLNYRKTDKHTTALCISIIVGYLLFSIMTGELGSAFFVGLILGMGIRMHQINMVMKHS